MRFISIVVFVIGTAGMISFMGFINGTFGKPYGTIALFCVVIGGGAGWWYLIIRHNNKVLKARADIAKATENTHKRKSSKDWV